MHGRPQMKIPLVKVCLKPAPTLGLTCIYIHGKQDILTLVMRRDTEQPHVVENRCGFALWKEGDLHYEKRGVLGWGWAILKVAIPNKLRLYRHVGP